MSAVAAAHDRSSGRSRLIALVWPGITIVVTIGLAAARLLSTPRFYFADDTQLGSFGQWWQLGDKLLHGTIPILEPHAWQAGNYVAEGQWGLVNPLIWIVAIVTRLSEHPVVAVTIVKIAFLALFSLGVFVLARSFGASASWAALAGILVPAAGFTVYMDSASWSSGLFNAAVLPWVWWALRRAVEMRRSPWPYLISSYLLVTFGYVFGVIILVVILAEMLVRAIVARDRGFIIRTLAAGAWAGLLTIMIYLPGILTAPVTIRNGWSVADTGFLNADLTDVGSAASPFTTATVGAWWGPAIAAPITYLAWILPLFPLFLPIARTTLRRLIPLFVLAGVALALVIGPDQLGPLRWPVRFLPYLAIAAMVIFAVAATEAFPRGIPWRRAGYAAVATGVLTYLSVANVPHSWRLDLATAVVQLGAIGAVVWLSNTRRGSWTATARSAIAVGGAVAVTAVVLAPQLIVFPFTPLPKFAVPDSVSQMRTVLNGDPGDAFVVGDVYDAGGAAASFRERLMGNLWYVSDTHVGSLYTVLPFRAFSNDMCSDLRGATCAGALRTLWSVDPTTHESVADLMGLSTILAIRQTFPGKVVVPAGWRELAPQAYVRTFIRNRPVAGAGGPVWSGTGTRIHVVARTPESVSFRVDAVGPDARVAFSRLAYPGYSVNGGAKVAAPIRGWLLAVDLRGVHDGQIVTVAFRPPGFPLLIASPLLAAVIAVWWLIVRARDRRRAVRSAARDATAEPGRSG